MKPLMDPLVLLPVVFLLLQSFLVLFICVTVLRRFKIIKLPFGGVEYSEAIFACSIVVAAFLVSTASVPALFQAFKVFQNQDAAIFPALSAKAGQFFLVVLFFELLLLLVSFLLSSVFSWMGSGTTEIAAGNIPVSLVTSAMVIGFAIVLKKMAAEMIEYIVPHYLNFR